MDSNFPLRNLGWAAISLVVVAVLSWFTNPPQPFHFMEGVAGWCVAAGALVFIRMLFSSQWMKRLGLWLNGFISVMVVVVAVLVANAAAPYWNSLEAYGRTVNSFYGTLLGLPMGIALIALAWLIFSMLLMMVMSFTQSIFADDRDVCFI